MLIPISSPLLHESAWSAPAGTGPTGVRPARPHPAEQAVASQSPAISSRDGACCAMQWCCLTTEASCFRTAGLSSLPRTPRPP